MSHILQDMLEIHTAKILVGSNVLATDVSNICTDFNSTDMSNKQ